MCDQLFPRYPRVDFFFDRLVHGALVYRPVVGPGEYGSNGGKGPSDVFALSPVICPSIRKFISGVPSVGLDFDENGD